MSTISVTFPKPDDWHVHLRDDEMMSLVAPFSDLQFKQLLIMPNLTPPIITGHMAVDYQEKLIANANHGRLDYLNKQRSLHFMTIYLTANTAPDDIRQSYELKVVAAKYYPHGGTTNSGSGLSSPHDLRPETLEAMEELGMVLCVHGEVTPDVQPNLLQREFDFIPHLEWLVNKYPKLKIVVEHVSDRRMLRKVFELPDTVAATITGHHPFLTIHNAEENPHCLCMPVAKTYDDRDYLAQIILEAHKYPKIFFGSDSAPHLREKKSGSNPAAGVWSSPVVIPKLWEHFDESGGLYKWEAFEAFMCRNGAAFYSLDPRDRGNIANFGSDIRDRGTITLKREPWLVPELYAGMVPFLASSLLRWRVEGMEWFGTAYHD